MPSITSSSAANTPTDSLADHLASADLLELVVPKLELALTPRDKATAVPKHSRVCPSHSSLRRTSCGRALFLVIGLRIFPGKGAVVRAALRQPATQRPLAWWT